VSNYTKQVNFTEKDTKPLTDPGKVIKGAEFDSEFNLVATAVATKADSNNSTLTGTTSVASLALGGVAVTATAAELNSLAGSGITADDITLLEGAGTNVGTQLVTTDGTQTLQNKTISSPGISGGSINNTTIGDITKNTGAFTTLDAESLSVGLSNELTITNTGRLNSSTYIAANEFRIGATEIVDSNRDATFNSLVLGTDAAVTSVPQYATGTFNPTVRDFGGVTAPVGTTNARYVVVGDLVTLFMSFQNIDTTGKSASNPVVIQDLPFTAVNDTGTDYTIGSGYIVNGVNPTATDSGHFIPVLNNGTSQITLNASVNNNAQPELLLFGDLNDDVADIHITITYQKA